MPPVRSLSDFLREQPEEELQAMADGLRHEIERLQTELEIVEGALNRGRRRSPGTRSERATRSPSLKRSELLAIIREQGHPVRPAEMRDILAKRGILMATPAVRTGMARLVEDGKLFRVGEGLYMVNPADGTRNEADSPLFRVNQASESGEGASTNS